MTSRNGKTTENMMATDQGKPLPKDTDNGVDAKIRSTPLPETHGGETGVDGNTPDDDELDLANERRRLEEDRNAQAAQDPAKIPRPRA